MNKVRVLLFVDRMGTGGIQILLLNLLKAFDKDNYQFDVLLLDDGMEYPMEQELVHEGAAVYKLKGIWLNAPADYLRYQKAVRDFFKKHHYYDAVHLHSSSKNFLILKYAQKYGVPIRIAHSHNTDFQTQSPIKIFVGNLLKAKLIKYSTHCLACSELAGEWLLGKKLANAGRVMIIKNGINLEKYQYNPMIRRWKREELEVRDKIVIGNVGRFVPQKNHLFLLDIFAEIRKKEPNSMLILAGVGELMDAVKKKANKLGIENYVKFLGFRPDINELIQAMDLFLMPSLYEGFPVTAVEAQAAGLPCVLSGSITREAALLDETVYIDLKQPAEYWARQALAAVGKSKREDSAKILKAKGFDIADTCKALEHIYSGEV